MPDSPAILEPVVQATRYTVNCVPEDTDPDGHLFEIAVEYRGAGRWAAVRNHRYLDAAGNWSYGVSWPDDAPGSREPTTDAECAEYEAARDAWLAATRHDLDTALELAKAAAPDITVNGYTVSDALRMAKVTE